MDRQSKKNVIAQWIDSEQGIQNHEELFNPDDKSIDVKTELEDYEIKHMSRLFFLEHRLNNLGIDTNIYTEFLNKLMRLKVSKERKSRGEYVDVNRQTLDESKGLNMDFGGLFNRGQKRV